MSDSREPTPNQPPDPQPDPQPAGPDQLRQLCPDDAAALDALLEAHASGAESGPIPPGAAERTAKLRQVLDLLDHDPVPPAADDLVARTMQRVTDERQRERFAEQVAMFSEPRRTLGLSLRQVLTAAAVFLISASLLLPVLDRTRSDARRTACYAMLGTAGQAHQSYAADNQGQMPRVAAAGGMWANLPKAGAPPVAPRPTRRNAENLFVLVRDKYATPDELACPSNPLLPGSHYVDQKTGSQRAIRQPYSYQNQFTTARLRFVDHPDAAVMADLNPQFRITIKQNGEVLLDQTTSVPTSASPAHEFRGQNTLLADGSVKWQTEPKIRRFVLTIRPGAAQTNATQSEASPRRGLDLKLQAADGASFALDNIWMLEHVRTQDGELSTGLEDSYLLP